MATRHDVKAGSIGSRAGDQSDPELEAGVGHHPRLGIGLPMSYIFATISAR